METVYKISIYTHTRNLCTVLTSFSLLWVVIPWEGTQWSKLNNNENN